MTNLHLRNYHHPSLQRLKRLERFELLERNLLFLTHRTIKRAAVADGNALDRARTNPAALTVAVIDSKMFLKLARFIVGIAIVGKRRAAPANRVTHQLGDRCRDRLTLLARQALRARGRSNAAESAALVSE